MGKAIFIRFLFNRNSRFVRLISQKIILNKHNFYCSTKNTSFIFNKTSSYWKTIFMQDNIVLEYTKHQYSIFYMIIMNRNKAQGTSRDSIQITVRWRYKFWCSTKYQRANHHITLTMKNIFHYIGCVIIEIVRCQISLYLFEIFVHIDL